MSTNQQIGQQNQKLLDSLERKLSALEKRVARRFAENPGLGKGPRDPIFKHYTTMRDLPPSPQSKSTRYSEYPVVVKPENPLASRIAKLQQRQKQNYSHGRAIEITRLKKQLEDSWLEQPERKFKSKNTKTIWKLTEPGAGNGRGSKNRTGKWWLKH